MIGRWTVLGAVLMALWAPVAGCSTREPAPAALTPAWSPTVAIMTVPRVDHALALLGDGRVLACGGVVSLDADGGPVGLEPVASCDLFDPHAGTWRPAGTMLAARRGLTLTVVESGRVLACGGGHSSCELSDPSHESWGWTASMTAARRGATATLLNDGRVLMVGGDADGTAELWRPGAVAWRPAGAIAPRHGATATRLGDGCVLVVGGTGPSGPSPNVDLFDPTSESWAAAPALLGGPRAEHTATRLRSGGVLVTGGTGGAEGLATTIVFDETDDTWAPGPSMTHARRRHCATLLPSGDVALVGGVGAGGLTPSVELYRAGTVYAAEPLSTARAGAGAVVLATGAVLVVGGETGSGSTATAELYDPTAIEREPRAPGWLARARYDHTSTLLLDDTVLLVGGSPWYADPETEVNAERYDPVTGVSTPAGILSVGRAAHTATLLSDGSVLVVGGWMSAGSVEAYDPAANAWAPRSSTADERAFHTATLLQDGRVLVVGGGALATIELYEPLTDSWSPGASMSTARSSHTATLLVDGRVLLAGGTGSSGQAEVYDPESDSWQVTGGMTERRSSHSATLLADGRVLVAGGRVGAETILATAEVYEPATGLWSSAGDMSLPRWRHTAARLPSGDVLVTGGSSDCCNVATSHTAETYHVASGTWRPAGEMLQRREGHAARALSSGDVVVTGGDDYHCPSRFVERYDATLGAWQGGERWPGLRYGHTATLLPTGEVFLAHGQHPTFELLTGPRLFDPSTELWSCAGPSEEPRRFATATLLPSGKVLVAGGGDPGDGLPILGSSALYDPAVAEWQVGPPLTQARTYHTATLLPNGDVLVAGGGNGDSLSGTERYLPDANAWLPTASMAEARARHTATLLHDGRVVVAGGELRLGSLRRSLRTVEVYDPASDTWQQAADMAWERSRHTATLLGDGRILVTGGWSVEEGTESQRVSAEAFDPATGQWEEVAPMAAPRMLHTATRLAAGQVLVAGGYGDEPGTDPQASVEVFDPATGSWTIAPPLEVPRAAAKARFLLDDRVLIVGGYGACGEYGFDNLASYELYRPEAGYDQGWQPAVDQPAASVVPGHAVTLAGVGFRGGHDASGGRPEDGAADLPVVSLRGLATDTPWWVAPASFTDETLTFVVPPEHAHEESLVRVVVAGVPSQAVVLSVRRLELGATCQQAFECRSGHCVDGVCCESGCAGACRTCALPAAMGTCSTYAAGTDPDGECGGDLGCAGACDGAGACAYPAAGVVCAPAQCTGFELLGASFCDGAGGCVVGDAQTCAGGLRCEASGTRCLTACVAADDCQAGYTCDISSGTCGLGAQDSGVADARDDAGTAGDRDGPGGAEGSADAVGGGDGFSDGSTLGGSPERGCSCRQAPSGHPLSGAGPFVLGVLGLALTRRRRRRATTGAARRRGNAALRTPEGGGRNRERAAPRAGRSPPSPRPRRSRW